MKQFEIIKVLEKDLGTSDVAELNKLLRAKKYKPVKYRMTGKALGHFGFTGVIKAISLEGVKVFDANRTRLIKFSDIESFHLAKPRVVRPQRPKPEVVAKPTRGVKKPVYDDDEADDDDDFDDPDEDGDIFEFEDPAEQKRAAKKKKPSRRVPTTGSRFIPGK